MNEDREALRDEEEIDVVTVVDDEGREHDFELFTVLEVAGNEYAVLYPLEEDEDEEEDSEAIILRIETDENGEETLVEIEDEEEWNRVVAAWEAIISDEDEEEN